MSGSFNSPTPVQSFSIGNVVSAAARLYRSHFKRYLGIAFKAMLWFFIPVYGWAKYHMLNATISRLAYQELINQPESVTQAQDENNEKFWGFWLAQVLAWLILVGVNIVVSIVQFFVLVILRVIFGGANQEVAGVGSLIISLANLIFTLVGYVVGLWFQARVFIPELSLSIEEEVDASDSIGRSWELTKGNVFRLQLTIIVAAIMTLPLYLIALIPFFASIGYFSIAIATAAGTSTRELTGIFVGLALMGIALLGFLLVSFLTAPFWQALKAAIYYDLRSRQEGLDLQLGNR